MLKLQSLCRTTSRGLRTSSARRGDHSRFHPAEIVPLLCAMNTINSFRDLLVWQKAIALAERSYKVAQRLPKTDQIVLGYQLQKSAASIPSNFAEGFSRHSTAHYIQHLWTSHDVRR